ncbi:MAG: GAF domain-containing protein [Janthinobacterium lividum]
MGDGSLDADALAHAAARLLPVDGVGITVLVDDLRLPLGASSLVMQRAEELQTTLGEGPCLAAAEARTAVRADLPELLRRWPLYGTEILRQTPYRSAASVPLRTSDGQIFAALDLMSEEPQVSHRLNLDEVDRGIGTPLGALLDMCMRPIRDADGIEVLPEWYERATARRHDVWTAVGMVMGYLHQSGSDALSLLRQYAYSHDLDLDLVAAEVVARRLPVQNLLGRAARRPEDGPRAAC